MKKINIPASKSISNRVLFLSALSGKKIKLNNVLLSEDTKYMKSFWEQWGVEFNTISANQYNENLEIIPPQKLKMPLEKDFFIGNAGTVARFTTALGLIFPGKFSLNGVDRMKARPFKDLWESLQNVGVEFENYQNFGFLPATIKGLENEKQPTEISIKGDISSQFISAIMLVAPFLKEDLTIKIMGEIPSFPYIMMTIEILQKWGVTIKFSREKNEIKIKQGVNPSKTYNIPLDMSSMSYPLTFSLLTDKSFEIENWENKTLQGDENFQEIIKLSGGEISQEKGNLTMKRKLGRIENWKEFDFSKMPDVSMTAMILAATSEGKTILTGLESLRVKECDRLEAMSLGLKSLGISVEIIGDEAIKIQGRNLDYWQNLKNNLSKDLIIESFDDHRIAMCFGLLKVAFTLPIKISQENCVAKTWPNFWLDLASWNENLRPVSAVIIQKEDKFLIVKKPRKNNAWQFPQGGVDEGETFQQAGEREVKEECGNDLEILIKNKIGSYQYFFPADFTRHNENIQGAEVIFFLGKFISGKVEIDRDELCDFLWIEKDKFKEYFSKDYLKVVNNLEF